MQIPPFKDVLVLDSPPGSMAQLCVSANPRRQVPRPSRGFCCSWPTSARTPRNRTVRFGWACLFA